MTAVLSQLDLKPSDAAQGVWSNHGMSFKGSVAVLRSESDDSD